jgi:hypothetical protein
MVVHTCNPSYLGGGGWKIKVRGQPRLKLKTLPEKQTEGRELGCSSNGRVPA